MIIPVAITIIIIIIIIITMIIIISLRLLVVIRIITLIPANEGGAVLIENNDSNSGVETVTKSYDNTNNIDFKEKQRDT